MKIIISSFRLKQVIISLLILNILTGIATEKLETIASFKSNYKLMKAKTSNKKTNDPAAVAASVPSSTQAPPISGDAPGTEKKTSVDLPDMPIYYLGWIKYFRYLENGGEKPKMFFKNTSFEKQNPELKGEAQDSFGPIKIPSEKHFFFVIYKDTANILTSRENALMTVADSLIIDFIKTIPEDNNYLGGIKDFGKFSEGSCFEAATVKPGAFFKMSSDQTEPSKGMKESWLICSDDDVKKREMMNILIKLKLKKQHNLGVFVSLPQDPKKKKR